MRAPIVVLWLFSLGSISVAQQTRTYVAEARCVGREESPQEINKFGSVMSLDCSFMLPQAAVPKHKKGPAPYRLADLWMILRGNVGDSLLTFSDADFSFEPPEWPAGLGDEHFKGEAICRGDNPRSGTLYEIKAATKGLHPVTRKRLRITISYLLEIRRQPEGGYSYTPVGKATLTVKQ